MSSHVKFFYTLKKYIEKKQQQKNKGKTNWNMHLSAKLKENCIFWKTFGKEKPPINSYSYIGGKRPACDPSKQHIHGLYVLRVVIHVIKNNHSLKCVCVCACVCRGIWLLLLFYTASQPNIRWLCLEFYVWQNKIIQHFPLIHIYVHYFWYMWCRTQ